MVRRWQRQACDLRSINGAEPHWDGHYGLHPVGGPRHSGHGTEAFLRGRRLILCAHIGLQYNSHWELPILQLRVNSWAKPGWRRVTKHTSLQSHRQRKHMQRESWQGSPEDRGPGRLLEVWKSFTECSDEGFFQCGQQNAMQSMVGRFTTMC